MRHGLLLAVLALALASPAAALDLPARKPGLWDIKMTIEGRDLPPQAVQQCIDAATDKLMNSIGGNMSESCSKQTVQRVGNTIVVDSTCQFGGATSVSHGVISGDFNSAYTVKVNTRREGGAAKAPNNGAVNLTIEAKWAGACKSDQKPGDMILGNGTKINVRMLQGLQGLIKGGAPK